MGAVECRLPHQVLKSLCRFARVRMCRSDCYRRRLALLATLQPCAPQPASAMAGSSSAGSSEWVDVEPFDTVCYYPQVGERPPRVSEHTVSSVLRVMEAQQQTIQVLLKEVRRQDDDDEQLPKMDGKKGVEEKGKKNASSAEVPGKLDKQSKDKCGHDNKTVEVPDLPKGRGGCVHGQTSRYANQLGSGMVCASCGAKLLRRISGETVFTDPSAPPTRTASSAKTEEDN